MNNTASIEQCLLEKSLQSGPFSEDGIIKGVFVFSHDFPAFDGHFPGKPVLPGVVQLAAVRLLACRYLRKDLALKTVDHVKFKSMVQPEKPVTVSLYLEGFAKEFSLSFTITTEKGKTSVGKMTCLDLEQSPGNLG